MRSGRRRRPTERLAAQSQQPPDGASFGPACRVADARPRRSLVVTGEIVATDATYPGGGPSPACRCQFSDGTGTITFLVFGCDAIPDLEVGVRCTVEGVPFADGAGGLVIWNPSYHVELSGPASA
jgi:hypothetical protein